MLKTRDFYLMKVYDTRGKYLGAISDIGLDFYGGYINGFVISSLSIFTKKNFVRKENIILINNVIIASKLDSYKGLVFSDIKLMDVIDRDNVMKGIVDDLIIEKKDLAVKGIVMSSGLIDTMFNGKEIILLNGCILCEKFILYRGNRYIKLQTLPHNLKGV